MSKFTYRASSSTGATVAALVWLALVIVLCYGWVANIITLYNSNFDTITGQLVLRVVGIFVAPLGTIMGYL